MRSNFIMTAIMAVFAPLIPLCAQVPSLINYQGRIAVANTNFDGSGLFKFAFVDSAGTTTFWSNDGTSTLGGEPTSSVSLVVVKGLYSVQLGDTTVPNMTSVPTTVFSNPDVRLRVWFNDGASGFQLLSPDKRITAVGYALVADTVSDGAITSSKIAPGAVTGNKIAGGVIDSTHLSPGLTLGGTTSGTFSGGLTGNVDGNATNFTGSLAGDVVGPQGTTVVSKVGTSTAANVHAAEVAANAATAANTSDTIVKRDGSGNFAAGTMTGNVTGSAASFTGALAGDVTGTQGATSIAATTVTGKPLTGYTATAGTVSSTDSVLTAIGKLSANDALKAPLSSPTFTGTVTGNFSGPLTGNVSGSASSFTGLLAGDVTGSQEATSIASNVVTGKALTGFVPNAGTVGAADTILTAIGKLSANDALKAPLSSPTFTGTVTGSFSGPLTGNVSGSASSFTGSLVGDVTGTQGATILAATVVTGKDLTGYTSNTGAISAADTILSAIGKLNGNISIKAPTASPTFTGTLTLPVGTATSAPLLLATGTNLTTPTFGALEFDGTNLYITNNSTTPTRKTLAYTDSPAQTATWIFTDVKTVGTDGGSASAGSWDRRTLNTTQFSSGSACTLTNSQFTLQPGTYTIRASAPAYNVFRHKIRLLNVTDATSIYGSAELASSGVQSRSVLTARVQVTSAKVFQIEHHVSNSASTVGFGQAANGGGGAQEVYTIVEITQ